MSYIAESLHRTSGHPHSISEHAGGGRWEGGVLKLAVEVPGDQCELLLLSQAKTIAKFSRPNILLAPKFYSPAAPRKFTVCRPTTSWVDAVRSLTEYRGINTWNSLVWNSQKLQLKRVLCFRVGGGHLLKCSAYIYFILWKHVYWELKKLTRTV